MAKKSNVVENVNGNEQGLNLESVAIVQQNFKEMQSRQKYQKAKRLTKWKDKVSLFFGAIAFFGLTIGMCILLEMWWLPTVGLGQVPGIMP